MQGNRGRIKQEALKENKTERQLLCDLYDQLQTQKAVGEHFGMDQSTISWHFRKHGITTVENRRAVLANKRAS